MISTLMLSAFLVLSPAQAADFGTSQYGSAPPSLDFPSGMSDARMRKEATLTVKKNDWIRNELFFLSSIDPFPTKNVALVDPITKKKVAKVLVGPAFKARGYGANYDYYRYVSFINVSKRKEQLYNLPMLHSECHQKSELWSSYGVDRTYTSTVKIGVTIEALGLDASFSDSRAFHMNQYVAAESKIADYIPYAEKQDWYGSTHIQLLDSKTGKTKFLEKPTNKSPWWIYLFFPLLAREQYPLPFQVKDAVWTFIVEMENVKDCGPSFGV